MDPLRNPFSFGAGNPPALLAGRDREIEQFDILLGRLGLGKSDQSIVVYGLRGVGKTVFLLVCQSRALASDWLAPEVIEIKSDTDFRHELADRAWRALLQLDRRRSLGESLKRLGRIVSGFKGKVTSEGDWEVGFDPSAVAASGDIEHDLVELFVELGEAAREHETGILFLVDEAHMLGAGELEAVCAAMHKMSQKRLPVALVVAGLPQILGQLARAKSYSERLFSYPHLDRLAAGADAEAVQGPIEAEGESIEPQALGRLLELADGYPAFLQAYGDGVWQQAVASPISLDDVELAAPVVQDRLDREFFQVRLEKATKAERLYLSAMADLGDGPYRVGEIAAKLGRGTRDTSRLRDGLIKKGIVYDPAHGQLEFSVPHYADFLRRKHPFDPASTRGVRTPSKAHPRKGSR